MAEPTSCSVLPAATARGSTPCSTCGRARARRGLARTNQAVSGGAPAAGGDRPGRDGLPGCGVSATGHGRRLRRLHDIPAFGAPVELVWRQRRYQCGEPARAVAGFSEDHALAPPRAKLIARAAWWAISCIWDQLSERLPSLSRTTTVVPSSACKGS